MTTIAALFRDRDRAAEAVAALRAAGFDDDAVLLLGSPTSAGEAAEVAARSLERPAPGLIDLGAAIGGQAELGFPESERTTVEKRVAQGDTLVRVEAADHQSINRAQEILRQAGADRVLPGTIRD